MARIELTVTMKGIYEYERPAYGYGYETAYIYNMESEDGKVYVWKTTAFMTIEVPYTGKPGRHCFEDRKGNPVDHSKINKDDVIRITASVKGESEYKGQPQTELTRVKVVERVSKAKTREEIKDEKKQRQMASLQIGDAIWYGMKYKQYKEHYSDCETICGSFRRNDWGESFVDVILKADRLKASGVRGQHYAGYEFFVTENGERSRVCYRAVNEDNAFKRCQKEFPNAEIEAGKIYPYDSNYDLSGYVVTIGAEQKEEPAVVPEQKYEGSAQEGFDLFWEWANQ